MPPKTSKKNPSKTPKKTKDIDSVSKETNVKQGEITLSKSDIIPIILESPNKIKKILSIISQINAGQKYIVLASCGHFRSLSNNPSKNDDKTFNGMGFSIENEMINIEYIEDSKKKSIISNLKSKCSSAKTIYLATDPDREGEAIAWHISELLAKRGRKFFRIKFNSITKSEVLKALENPSNIDMDLVFAQQTRQIIDKWIGFKVSPLCWQNTSAKSAGRVQSPALKLLVDREREVINFKSREYFTIQGHFSFNTSNKQYSSLEIKEVPLKVYYDKPKPIQFDSEDALLRNASASPEERQEEAMKVIDNIFNITKKNNWKFSIEEKETQIHPPPPYTTLTILQDCNTFLKIKPEQTMFLLQKMYESGWITYHRTDSVVLSTEGLFQTRQALMEYPLGSELITEKPRNYTNRSLNAQEAHEPIRPTHFEICDLENYLRSDLGDSKDKIDLDSRIFKIYSMIYLRTLATQCKPQTNTVYNLTFSINNDIQFSISYSYLKYLGYKTLYQKPPMPDIGSANVSLRVVSNYEAVLHLPQRGRMSSDTTLTAWGAQEDKSKANPNKFSLKTIGNPEKIPEWLKEISRIGPQGQDITNVNLYEFELESHHTKPPPYFTESSIIKELESYGIGRPSTYASILSKLFDNNYMLEDKQRILHPTALGIQLVDFLETKYKSHFMNLEYTQNMEKVLDEIAEGKTKWTSNVIKFIKEFPV